MKLNVFYESLNYEMIEEEPLIDVSTVLYTESVPL